jgi:hypothetical protein
MIERWISRLAERQFAPRAGESTVFVREQGLIELSIWENQSTDGKQTVQINVTVSLADKYLRPPAHVSALVAHIGPRDVSLVREGRPTWWRDPEDEPAAWKALSTHGFAWLDERADAKRLIDELSTIIASNGYPPEPSSRGLAQLAGRFFFRQEGVAKGRGYPPVFDYYLGLLHDDAGNRANACAHLQRWLKHVERGQFPSEPGRTQRQLTTLGCDHS